MLGKQAGPAQLKENSQEGLRFVSQRVHCRRTIAHVGYASCEADISHSSISRSHRVGNNEGVDPAVQTDAPTGALDDETGNRCTNQEPVVARLARRQSARPTRAPARPGYPRPRDGASRSCVLSGGEGLGVRLGQERCEILLAGVARKARGAAHKLRRIQK